jgi:hypothetical protein
LQNADHEEAHERRTIDSVVQGIPAPANESYGSRAFLPRLSFFRAEIVQNPNAWDRFIARLRARVIGCSQPA